MDGLVNWLKTWRSSAWSALLSVFVAMALLLSGCVHYDVDLKFSGSNHGEITQYVRLDESLPSVGGSIAAVWLDTLEEHAQQLGGRIKHPSDQEWVITLPFYGTKDLQTKFNQVLQYQAQYQVGDRLSRKSSRRPSNPVSYLNIQTYSFVLWQRNHLQYDLDLRGVAVPPAMSEASTPADPAITLDFSLNTPWGVHVIDPSNTSMPVIEKNGKRLIWHLKPGTINHLEAVFWVPNALGIGIVAIVFLVLLGMGIKKWGSKPVVTS